MLLQSQTPDRSAYLAAASRIYCCLHNKSLSANAICHLCLFTKETWKLAALLSLDINFAKPRWEDYPVLNGHHQTTVRFPFDAAVKSHFPPLRKLQARLKSQNLLFHPAEVKWLKTHLTDWRLAWQIAKACLLRFTAAVDGVLVSQRFGKAVKKSPKGKHFSWLSPFPFFGQLVLSHISNVEIRVLGINQEKNRPATRSSEAGIRSLRILTDLTDSKGD